jgi:hypothetical protein
MPKWTVVVSVPVEVEMWVNDKETEEQAIDYAEQNFDVSDIIYAAYIDHGDPTAVEAWVDE